MVPQVRGDVEEQEIRMEVLSPGNTKNNKFQQLRKRQSILAVSAGTQSHVSYKQRKQSPQHMVPKVVHLSWCLSFSWSSQHGFSRSSVQVAAPLSLLCQCWQWSLSVTSGASNAYVLARTCLHSVSPASIAPSRSHLMRPVYQSEFSRGTEPRNFVHSL